MSKVRFFDRRIVEHFLKITSAISATLSLAVLFVDIPEKFKHTFGWIFLGFLALIYLMIWLWSNRLNKIDINVEGSDVTIKVGDIFQQPGLKAIAFNEYFDTQVDNQIISEHSLNGIFIKNHLDVPASALDQYIENYAFDSSEIIEKNSARETLNKVPI